jgi:hypothetical protein
MPKPLTPAEKLHRAFEDLAPFTLHAGEILVQWIEDNSDGQVALIRFNEETHPLKELCTSAEGKIVTAVIHAIFIEKDDAGEPINQARRYQVRNAELKGGETCKKFHIVKAETEFHRWLYAERGLTELAGLPDPKARTAHVEEWLRETLLKGESSKMLDHNTALRDQFIEQFWKPYHAWRNERDENGPHSGAA